MMNIEDMSISEIEIYLDRLKLSSKKKIIKKYKVTKDIYYIDNNVLDIYIRNCNDILTESDCEFISDGDLIVKLAEANDVLIFEDGWIEFDSISLTSFNVDDFNEGILEDINE